MLFNAPIIFHHLRPYFNTDTIVYTNKASVRTTMFYNVYFNMDNYIVLLKGADLEDCLARVNHSILVCTTKPERIPDVGTNDLIVLNDISAEQLSFNILNHIINNFLSWEGELNNILYNNGDFKEMLNHISDVVDMPVALTDSNMHYIAYSDSSEIYMEFVDDNEQLPLEMANQLLSDSNYKKLEKNKDAYVHSAGLTCVYKNIFHNNSFIGRLSAIVDVEMDDVEYVKAIFNQAGHYIEALYNQYGSFDNKKALLNRFHDMLIDILDDKAAHQNELNSLLDEFGASKKDLWDVIVFLPDARTNTLIGTTYMCSQIEQLWSNAICVYHNDEIVVLRDISLYNHVASDSFEIELKHIMNKLSLISGISRSFTNIRNYTNIRNARIQADYALMAGKEKESDNGIYLYNDYALDYVIRNNITDVSKASICHPALIILEDYDRLHGTSYIETLRVYIEERYNAVAAAGRLYIHRSSFIKRMNRIDELTALDFNDTEERLYLEISIYLYYNKN